jgi:hypothetical protein
LSLEPLDRQRYCGELAEAESSVISDPGYRFMWVPSFDPTRVVSVRMEAGRPVISGKLSRHRGRYTADDLGKSTKRFLTPDEWKLLNQRMENAGIWEQPDPPRVPGLDGSTWFVEARRAGTYRFHRVWSPEVRTFPQYRKACEYLLTLAGIHPGDDRVY